MPDIVTAERVGEILKVKTERIWELTRENKLPFAIRLGARQYRYDLDGLQKYIGEGGNHSKHDEADREN